MVLLCWTRAVFIQDPAPRDRSELLRVGPPPQAVTLAVFNCCSLERCPANRDWRRWVSQAVGIFQPEKAESCVSSEASHHDVRSHINNNCWRLTSHKLSGLCGVANSQIVCRDLGATSPYSEAVLGHDPRTCGSEDKCFTPEPRIHQTASAVNTSIYRGNIGFLS